MTSSNFRDVGDFQHKFHLPHVVCNSDPDVTAQYPCNGPGPQGWDDDILDFRIKFMQEELDEFKEAVEEGNHAKAFDALLDLAYVVFGTAHMQGYPWESGWRAVQEANMKKVRAAKDGSDSVRGSAWDVVKPPGWTAPDIESVLRDWGFKI